MYSVYKITNLINNKIYIGSTNDAERRWREHKSHAFNPNQIDYNYPLQKAFRKYGVDNFTFGIIKSNFETRYDAEEFEKQMIIHYDTCNTQKGYNQSSETHNGLTDEAVRNKLKRKIIAIDIQNPNNKIIFNSVTEAANELKTERKSISSCANGSTRYSNIKGFIIRYYDNEQIQEIQSLPIQQVIDEYNFNNPVINGERHSIAEWCEIYKISRQSIYYRIRKKGMDVVSAITTPKGK